MDGLTATKQIRQQELLQGFYTPIVGLTAFAHRGKCLKVGMDDFLQKPVTFSELKDVMNKWSKPSKQVTPLSAEKEIKLEDFDDIGERLERIKKKISDLRNRYHLNDSE